MEAQRVGRLGELDRRVNRGRRCVAADDRRLVEDANQHKGVKEVNEVKEVKEVKGERAKGEESRVKDQ